ncbi:hypothetical protein G7Z17_g12647 [Cylindrodendrum hubeiense]|uniref:Uncharacterized protein n=1 Tax=Cylindrodendrum hubeiense TaxID=595255 RepID=A0A9P5GV38_9HYPO|nr:hypothetical protein G7Z17_g12647 [Cylindrodendrum hubeiense]
MKSLSTSLLFVAAATAALTSSPRVRSRGLVARDFCDYDVSGNAHYCLVSGTECCVGDYIGCMPTGYTCCSTGLSYCNPDQNCVIDTTTGVMGCQAIDGSGDPTSASDADDAAETGSDADDDDDDDDDDSDSSKKNSSNDDDDDDDDDSGATIIMSSKTLALLPVLGAFVAWL